MQLVYEASDILEAHIVAGMLRSRHLEVFVDGHYLHGGIGEMAPMGFARVYVAEEDFALAWKLVDDYRKAE
ncbi:putative signal transducing protein [Marinospirillum sp.]|uniref:putative signal transducing protein n=1 Tax=Marinospirillum sp. TaxID=2183934 RepID=UPI002870B205|nr:DUF2007 domain-containing protein [Marinospirillum sp.]MDR9467306.1 DUF2007 domain-containing protein [Marinospirillum sp.]